MLIELPMVWVITFNATLWPMLQVSLAWLFTRMPATWFNPPELNSWESSGRFYQQNFGIKRWKDRMPDAARWFGGGFAKGVLEERHPDYFRRFIRETWRGELCHWAAIACTPLFFLWNPWWANLIIVGYALAANMPCILIQRYNRARLEGLLRKTSSSRKRV